MNAIWQLMPLIKKIMTSVCILLQTKYTHSSYKKKKSTHILMWQFWYSHLSLILVISISHRLFCYWHLFPTNYTYLYFSSFILKKYYVYNIFTTNFKWQVVITCYYCGKKSNLNGKFKFELITTNYLWFVIKILWT